MRINFQKSESLSTLYILGFPKDDGVSVISFDSGFLFILDYPLLCYSFIFKL